jgi:hypothetical protein
VVAVCFGLDKQQGTNLPTQYNNRNDNKGQGKGSKGNESVSVKRVLYPMWRCIARKVFARPSKVVQKRGKLRTRLDASPVAGRQFYIF